MSPRQSLQLGLSLLPSVPLPQLPLLVSQLPQQLAQLRRLQLLPLRSTFSIPMLSSDNSATVLQPITAQYTQPPTNQSSVLHPWTTLSMTVPISSLLAASALGCSDSSLVWVLDTRDQTLLSLFWQSLTRTSWHDLLLI